MIIHILRPSYTNYNFIVFPYKYILAQYFLFHNKRVSAFLTSQYPL